MADCKTDQKPKGFRIKAFLAFFVFILLMTACKTAPEGLKNSQAYYDALACMEADTPVIVFLLDGLGYWQYEAAAEGGYMPYISAIGTAQKAETYWPSISPVGLAAMVTGAGPSDNGIKSREDKDIKVTDIFEMAAGMEKSAVLVEGDVKLINTYLEPDLNPDADNDGFTDREVFEAAHDFIQNGGYDLIFIHFHGIDDMAHAYGPMSSQAFERTLLIDGYVADLLEEWEGAVIISADHGQHENEEGKGEHGSKLPEDLQVPYVFIERLQ